MPLVRRLVPESCYCLHEAATVSVKLVAESSLLGAKLVAESSLLGAHLMAPTEDVAQAIEP